MYNKQQCSVKHDIHIINIQGYRKRWTGFETAITLKVLDGFTRLPS